jgi:hypothetical protein
VKYQPPRKARAVGVGATPITLERLVAGHVGDDLAILAGHGSGIGAVGAEADDPNTLIEPGLAGRAGLFCGARFDREGVDLRRTVMVDKQFRAERHIDPLQQPVRHRRAGKADLPDRAGVHRSEIRMADQVVVEGRHEIEIADPLARDQPQRRTGLEARQADEGPVYKGHRQQRAHAHRVVEGHDAERALATGVQVLRDMGEGGGALGAVPARHTLRPPGRARSVKQQRQVLGPGSRPEPVRAALQVFETAGGPVDLADCDPRKPLGRCRVGDGARRDIVEDDRGGVGIGEAIVQLPGLDPPVERRHADAGELARPMQASHFEPVLQDDRQPVATPEAEPVVKPPARRAISSYQDA